MLSSLFDIGSIELVMDDYSWIYQDSPQELRRMNYCNGIQGFINYATSIMRNISGGGIRCPCKRCKNKKFLDPNVVTIHLLHKRFVEEYLCWYAHKESFVPHETMVERMIGSTFRASIVYGVVNENNNPYMTIVMDAMRMNQGHASQCTIVDEKPNADAKRFFNLLKDSNEPL
jgi:hypothetical protein